VTVLRTVAGYELDDDPGRIDRELVWDFLSKAAYWGRWRGREDVEHQINDAWRIVGAYPAYGNSGAATAALHDAAASRMDVPAGAVGGPGMDPDEAAGMVGFARAVSDGMSLAYLADVFVLPEHRGRGLGTGLVAAMIEDGPGAGFRWMLHTADAHALYARFGFANPDHTYLERPAVPVRPGRSYPRAAP
jgi:GNAT superfamily N-acetyltransferase